MKSSKILILGIFVILLFSNFRQRSIWFQNGLIEVYFSNKLDIADLSKIKTDLLEKGIKLNYDYLKFGEDGKLVAIKYRVRGDKFGGADETDNLNNEIGFIINTNPNRKYDIIVGPKDDVQKRRIALSKQN